MASRIRADAALAATAISSGGDSSQAGQMCNPGRVMLRCAGSTIRCRCESLRAIGSDRLVDPFTDDRRSLGNAAYLQGALGGLVETCVLDDSYHVVTIDRQREESLLSAQRRSQSV